MKLADKLCCTRSSLARFIGLALLVCSTAQALEVASGSTGTLGALIVTAGTTVALPPDGVLNYTTVTVASGATLTFLQNAASTPVYMLATGDITISGTIDVSASRGLSEGGGDSGPGGWGGGNRAQTGLAAGPGKGPGGASILNQGNGYPAGNPGSYASDGNNSISGHRGNRYGSPLLIPLLGGSGGSGGTNSTSYGGGGGGGGAILLASNTQISVASTGRVNALGGAGHSTNNGGSGGAIRLLAPVISLSGTLDARGGGDGGNGFIRTDTGILTQGSSASIQGVFSSGQNTVIFPTNAPSLRLTNVAGNNVPLNQTNEVILNLPPSGVTTQPVEVRAEGHNSVVAFSIVLVPEAGERRIFNGTIDNRTQNPATRSFNVDFPLDTPVHVHLWTQQTVRSN
jgi:hypothetical protein